MGILDPIGPDEERIWLLDVDLGGRVERFATRAVTVSRADGSTLRYRAGLGELRINLADASSATMGIPLEIDADPEGSTWAKLSAQGLEADRRPGTLYRWTPGEELERALVVLTGFYTGVRFDQAGEGLELTLTRIPWDPAQTVPHSDAVVSAQTWPVRTSPTFETDERIRGAYYPRVYGYVGRAQAGGTPALVVEYRLSNPQRQTSIAVIAEGEVDATNVRIFDYDEPGQNPVSVDRPVLTTSDLLGRTVSVCDMQGVGWNTFHWEPGRAFYVSWRNLAGFGGGVPRIDGTGPIRGWAEVVLDLLDTYTDVDVDRAAFEGEASYLNAWKLDGVINQPAEAWRLIESELVPLVPVRVLQSSAGLYFRVMRWEATASMATHRIEASRAGVERLAFGARPAESMRNRFVLDYRADRQTGKYDRRVRLQSRLVPGNDRVFSSRRCFRSRRRLKIAGQPRSGIVTHRAESSWIEEDATALRTVESWAAQWALPPRPASYQLPVQWETQLEIGDVVLLTDHEVEIVDRVCLVHGITLGAGELLVDLLILEDPLRVTRALP